MARSLSREAALIEIARLRSDLNEVLDEIEEQRKGESLSVTHLAYLNDYAVVRLAGYLEQLCFHAISGRVGEAVDGHLQAFVNSWFYKSPNLTATQFRDLFKRFGSEVDLIVQEFLDSHLNRELMNSLLETRNAVAHGKEFMSSRREQLQTYRELVADVDQIVHDLLLAETSTV